jgi:hypothetical protein
MKTINLIIGSVVVLLLFGGGFWAGRATKKCPTITRDTTYVYDTTWYPIYDTISYIRIDTLELPGDTTFPIVDTALILKDHFIKRGFAWEKKDTNININGYSVITQNKLISTEIKYKWLKPQTIINNTIDNTITYNRYLYGGVSIPIYPIKIDSVYNINYIGLEAIYAYPKGYIGFEWQPYVKTYSLKMGIKILQFKQRK